MMLRCFAILVLALLPACASPSRPPNVVLFFADDLGYGDLSCYGSPTNATPHIDSLARDGLRFTHFYVAQPVCSASRAALLTGCYPNRVGIAGALGPRAKIGLNPDETTLADVLKSRGYATAIFGKWHLGDAPNLLPNAHGFDEYFGFPYSNDMWPRHPQNPRAYQNLQLLHQKNGILTVIDDDVFPDDQKPVTREITRRSVEFIDSNADAPFFLYVPYPMPHVPLYVSPEFDSKTGRGMYADVLSEIDWSVGQVLATLERHNLDDDTIVIFASDNGPWLSYGNHAGTTGGLREGKGTTWEGGVRVPCLIRAPGRVAAGTHFHRPCMTIDILPTIAAMVNAERPSSTIDGVDLSPWLMSAAATRAKAPASDPHEALFFYYNANELQAVRSGDWKLYLPHSYASLEPGKSGLDGIPAKYTTKPCAQELYNLANDPAETTDVAAQHPETVAQLLQLAERARADLGDKLTKRPGTGVRPAGEARWPQAPN
jgi:arylsulfatase